MTLAFRQRVDDDGLGVPAGASGLLDEDGRFTLAVPELDQVEEPIELSVAAPNGVVLSTRPVKAAELDGELEIEAVPAAPFVLRPESGPATGVAVRLTGRVIDDEGRPVPHGLAVTVWGVRAGTTDVVPLVLTQTQVGGYFGADWVRDELERAHGTVGSSPPTAIPLTDDARLPTRVLLVVHTPDDALAEDCDCEAAPPRAPDQRDLVANPEAFSQDLGGRCVDLTAPNRVLEEFAYFLAVRTSEPEVQGLVLGGSKKLPPGVLGEIRDLSLLMRKSSASRSEDDDGDPLGGLDALSAKNVLRAPGALDEDRVGRVLRGTKFNDSLLLLQALRRKRPGRVPIDAENAIDWDSTPTIHQAVTVAHGHVLQYRQVWRADGYSLGDLLYSLPLAPGQKRQVAVVDWERRTRSARTEALDEEEQLRAIVSRDRDISEIARSSLTEEMSGGSSTSSWGVGAGVGGGVIAGTFGIFGGVAGGAGGASTESWQDNSRAFAGNSLQQLRDRTMQRASAVRGQRSTVVQTVAQGETTRATTEVVANHNHCHSLTVEWFEVLRHLQVSHELADVQECLFVPLRMDAFDRDKALRWREALSDQLIDRSLDGAFDALERIARDWNGYELPQRRFSEEAPERLDGELTMSFMLPRPPDAADGAFQQLAWALYGPLLPVSPLALFYELLERRAQRERDRVFREQVAPQIAQRFVQRLRFAYVLRSGLEVAVPLDPTLVSRYAESVPLYVSLRPGGALPPVPREEIARFKVWSDQELPPDARILAHSGKVRYATPHIEHLLFSAPRLLDDIGGADQVVVSTPLARRELRDPRQEDRDLAARLVRHLNDNLEHYHRAIWLSMDRNRRYMLLDGVIAPNSGGRSVASVVENRLIGIAGNCLIMPVAPGNRLDPMLQDDEKEASLRAAYAADAPPPVRISLSTRGVYAEAIQGACNSCERKDDTRFWRWEESPIPDEPPAIQPVDAGSRAADEPTLTPTPTPEPIVAIQNAPQVPDPLGLRDALGVLARADAFRDVTGLEGTQRNAMAAYQSALDTAKYLGGQASALAQQQMSGRSADNTLAQIQSAQERGLLSTQQAQQLAHATLQAHVGDVPRVEEPPTADPTVASAIEAAAQSESGEVVVRTPEETVSASFEGGDADAVGAALVPSTHWLTNEWTDTPFTPEWRDHSGHWVRDAPVRDWSRIASRRVDLNSDGTLVGHVGRVMVATRLVRRRGALFEMRLPLRITYPSRSSRPGRLAGTGKLPVVFLLHGQDRTFHVVWDHANPISTSGGERLLRHSSARLVNAHLGFDYLQSHLAEHGIVSVSIGTGAANKLGSLVETRADLVLAAIRVLQRLDADPRSRYFERLDFDRVGLLGHSRGGDGVLRAAEKNLEPANLPNAVGIRAVCALAPTDFTGGGPDRNPLSPNRIALGGYVNHLSVLYGSLDGDVCAVDGADADVGTGFRHYDRATCEKSMLFLQGLNHDRFNRRWPNHDPFAANSEPRQAVRHRSVHEELLKEYAGGLFRWQLNGEQQHRALFDGTRANGQGVAVAQRWMLDGRQIDDLEDPATNTLGAPHAAAMGAIASFESVTDVVLPAPQPPAPVLEPKLPHRTSVLAVDLTSAPSGGATLCFTSDIPTTAEDWTPYTYLSFDVSANFDVRTTAALDAGELPRFSVALVDATGATAMATHAQINPTLHRPWYHRVRIYGVLEDVTLLHLETVRVPLTLFTGIDPARVRQVQLHVDPNNGAQVFADALHLGR